MLLLAMLVAISAAAEDVPLPAYELEALIINEPVENPALLFSETSSWPPEAEPQAYTQYVFHLTADGTRIELGRETEMPRDDHYPKRGMNPNSFECAWAVPGESLSLTWSTHGVFGGHWVVQALVLLVRRDGGWKEVFRTFEDANYSGGWGYKFYGNMILVEDKETGKLLLRLEHEQFDGSDTREPLMRPDGAKYSRYTYRRTEWPCEVADERLVIGEGTTYLDLRDESFPAREVAHYMAPLWNVNPSEHEATIDAKLQELKDLNPEVADHDQWTGRIRIGTEPAYEPDSTHRWMMR